MTIKEAQETVDKWITTYGVRYFNELTNMAILTEEVGEVARIMARTYGEQSLGLASIKPEDEVCGWGPLKPGLCQRFRNPKWVLVCLCMAGVCQVSGWSHFRNGPLWL